MCAKSRVMKRRCAGWIALIEIDKLGMAVGGEDGSDICQVAALCGLNEALEVSHGVPPPLCLCGSDIPFDFAQGRLCPTLLKLILFLLTGYSNRPSKSKTNVKSVGQECPTRTGCGPIHLGRRTGEGTCPYIGTGHPFDFAQDRLCPYMENASAPSTATRFPLTN